VPKDIAALATDKSRRISAPTEAKGPEAAKENGGQRHAKKMRSGVSRAWCVVTVIGRTTKDTADQNLAARLAE